MSAGPLRVDRRDDGVVVLTLAQPERRNAMTGELTDAWVAAIDSLKGDRSVRAVLVTGEGSAFCSGGDLSWIGQSPDLTVDAIRDRMLPFYRAWLGIRDLEVPTIAAINGHAIGAGLCLALACDLRYAAASAAMSVPFTSLGMHPGMATTWLLPEVVGLPVARELLFTGRRVDAEEALRLGLVNGVFEAEKLFDSALDVACRIAANAPVAVRLAVAALRNGGHSDIEAALQYEALAQPVTFASADLTEGLAAAKERRPPVFKGR
ncbi:MAG: enoyl-CoA hydratase/isomerase family protein [Frankiaceae bacterium]|nr:enoyl-CoA hydratase/isomerase family protein [Frankiaceae bacterium]MBV9872198.1 enoyl-CoA hydratase/isomerase family protein [Frankiaceae bacterium]